MCDKLVYDLSQEVEGTPNIFIRKDWLNILDNMNSNYSSNQSIIDTSQLSNSNKYMAYREAYLAVPMLLTMKCDTALAAGKTAKINDYSIGLKNWFGTIIHSLTVDYNGTTIIQQTPYVNMWNMFRLLTSLSYADVVSQGATIGFYPDTVDSWTYNEGDIVNPKGINMANNDVAINPSCASSVLVNFYNRYDDATQFGGNTGLTIRSKWINYDALATDGVYNEPYSRILPTSNAQTVWKSQITLGRYSDSAYTATEKPVQQVSVMGIIYLKHLASFFNMCPLLKGVFMKLTLNLNNATSTITIDGATNEYEAYTSNVPVGGVNPLLVPSIDTGNSWIKTTNNGTDLSLLYNISVGSTCTDNSLSLNSTQVGKVARSVYLYVPAYSFNPTFEEAYLASSPKMIKYSDVYQYQVDNVTAGETFNRLITNGLANIKSVLIIPFLYQGILTVGSAAQKYNQWQNPFDTAGAGTTAPMVSLTNFNVQVSGQNAIYNTQRYGFEEFVNQLYGENAVNGGLTDGLTSGLIDFHAFQQSQCYYYVNVERMLPVEKNVPKSIFIQGTNNNTVPLSFIVFVEYEAGIKVDLLTGARVA